jgi:hypothetical protein
VPNDRDKESRAALDAMAGAVGLDISAHRDGVAANFARIEALASLVTAFPLPEPTEIGVIFVP